MAAEQESSEQPKRFVKGKKKVLAGAAVLLVLVCVLGLCLFWSGPRGAEVANDEPEIGVLDLQQLIKVHPDYAKLQSLQQECAQLEASLAAHELTMKLSAPQANGELFQEAAEQKNRLDALERHSQLVEELNALAEKKRQELKPQFDEEQNQASKPYLNEMLNLRVKIDSADVLGLSEEQVQQMLDRIDELQQQRGRVLTELLAEQEKRFRQLIEAENSGPMSELQQLEASYQQQMQQAEFEKQLAVQERNSEQVQQALSPIQQKISSAKKRTLLEAKRIQMQQLQEKIYDDIAGRAAKLAIMHRLTLVLASPADNLRGVDYQSGGAGTWQPVLSPVLGVNTLDLTEEMLQDIKAQPL